MSASVAIRSPLWNNKVHCIMDFLAIVSSQGSTSCRESEPWNNIK